MHKLLLSLNTENKKLVYDYLVGFMTDKRCCRFEEIIENRTRHCCVIIENVYQSHNISAVMRSCDCFGVQDIHVIDFLNPFKSNPEVDMGASKWLNINHYNSADATNQCLQRLRENGYKIIATTPHSNDVNIQDFDVSEKFALAFGTEKEGLSKEIIDNADVCMKIPMVGFTESLNISVSAAISLFYLTNRVRNEVALWRLSENEKIDLRLSWAMNSIKGSDLILRKFMENDCIF